MLISESAWEGIDEIEFHRRRNIREYIITRSSSRPLGGAYASKDTEIHLENDTLHGRSTLRSNRSFSPILRAEILKKINWIKFSVRFFFSLSRSLEFTISPFLLYINIYIYIHNNFDSITRKSAQEFVRVCLIGSKSEVTPLRNASKTVDIEH